MTTSARVDVGAVKVDHINDNTFTSKKSQKDGNWRSEIQHAVDEHIMKHLKGDDHKKMMGSYLRARFSLTKHDRPHAMKF